VSQPDTASSDAVRTFKARERWFALLLFCVGVPILVVLGVVSGDRPVDTPWQVAVIVVGLPAIGLMGISLWKSTVSLTADDVVVSRLLTTRRYSRGAVKAIVLVGGGEFQWAVLIVDHDLAFPNGQPRIPLLAGSGLRDLADLLHVPFLNEAGYRSYLEDRGRGSADIQKFEAGPPAPVRVNWILRSLPAGLCYVIGALVLISTVPAGMDEGLSAAVVTALVGLGLLAVGELLRRVLVLPR
jgi:hypothetical protein